MVGKAVIPENSNRQGYPGEFSQGKMTEWHMSCPGTGLGRNQTPGFFARRLPSNTRTPDVALTPKDRALLQRCLNHEAGAWNEFVDRYLGLIYHVVQNTAHLRSVPMRAEDVEDVAAEVLLQIVARDFAVLRKFRGHSSLSTYLTVIARRNCIHELNRRAGQENQGKPGEHARSAPAKEEEPRGGVGLETLEEVHKLLRSLPPGERQVVRLFYLEGRTYEEISDQLHLPVNSIGPILSRAKAKLRKGVANQAPAPHESQPKNP
jgi:RNA polymerase sigma-70 factor, ECF subfamily